ncbi:hypothetical protein LIER_27958 [Lithospermum erythrorhizon]|uniref:Pentatricopeptide repeat-containing protein n=1 Tax=Lithospermum erythrorhizon TaxID=34254 RepID=A0AAV3RE70_LITER
MRATRQLFLQAQPSSTIQTFLNGHHINSSFYGHLLHRCTTRLLLRPAKQLHSHLIISHYTIDNFLASKLISLYSKCQKIKDAHQVFDKMIHRNIFTLNAMLIGYCSNDLYVETLELFSDFFCGNSYGDVKPDHFTISSVLKAFSGLFTDVLLSRMCHCFVVKNGFDSDVFVLNGLITFYSRCDDMVSARGLFDVMDERDLVTWNSMISGYSQGGFYEECKEMYGELLNLDGLMPNAITLVSVLQACAHSDDLILGMEVHKYAIDKGLEMDLSLCNSIISLYAKCGSLEYARELLEEMSEKDEITYGALISGYMVHGFVDEALSLFREMRKPGLSSWNAVIAGLVQNNVYEGVLGLVNEMQVSGFKPNSVTLSIILPTISYFSNLKAGKELHSYAIKNNYDRNVYVATAVIDTYAKLGFIDGARIVFNKSEARSVIIWTAIISAYAAHGDAHAAILLFDEMMLDGIVPDAVTFTSVLAACAHSGLVDEAQRVFNSLFPKYGIHPMVEHYACMVGVFSRAGKLREALEFITKMPIEPSAGVWGALLNGASVSGDVELGKLASNHLFEMEPENTGNYVIMANLYAKAGRWHEAERVREKMKNIGLHKIAGSSWIETPHGVHCFVAKDESNTRSEEIYDTICGLLKLMMEEGYVMMPELDEEGVWELYFK